MSRKFSIDDLRALGASDATINKLARMATVGSRVGAGGYINARGIGARMGITEGGANGHLTRAGFQVKERAGYRITDAGRAFGKEMPQGLVWRASKIMPKLIALRDSGAFGRGK